MHQSEEACLLPAQCMGTHDDDDISAKNVESKRKTAKAKAQSKADRTAEAFCGIVNIQKICYLGNKALSSLIGSPTQMVFFN